MTTRPCPICAEMASAPLEKFSRDNWSVEQCAGCGHVYLKNPPGYEALAQEFAWEKTYESEHERRLTESPMAYRLDLATRFRHTMFRKSTSDKYRQWFGSGKVLDIGCGGAGEKIEGFTPYGIEISDELAATADKSMRAQGGYCIHGPGATSISQFEPEFFDGVVMFSYLEHEEHPLPVLKSAAHVLKPDGAIYVRVPNFGSLNRKITGRKWVGLRWPDHVNYFTVKDLQRVAGMAGLSVHLLKPIRLPVNDKTNGLLRPKTN